MNIERDITPSIRAVMDAPEVIVVTGLRRTGKTTLMRSLMEEIPTDNKLFLDLENPANRKLFEEANYDRIADNLRFLGLDLTRRGYLFLDEVQFLRSIPSVVKYLVDHYRLKCLLTGSAVFYLKNLFSESLSGRKYSFDLHPLSFSEFLRFKGNPVRLEAMPAQVTEAMHESVSRWYDEYLLYGGFPGVVLKDAVREKEMMLDDIFTSYFQMEVVQLGDFRRTNVIRDLILLLMERSGSRLDVQKLSKELGVARETLNNYLSFLEGTYFITLVRPFSTNRDTEIRSQPKIYLCDTGLMRRFSRVSDGALFENAAWLALRQRGRTGYFRKKSGVEIDFVVDGKIAFEIKQKADTKDVSRLRQLATELGLPEYRVVSRRWCAAENVIYGYQL
ncbi:MAG: ATP-binding protein [Deltaproteobacteria bacterium]|nr:ATP-binding protein [Deltaproteobacteria bacterium]